MERLAIRNLSVLIVGGKGTPAQLLRMALNLAGITNMTVVPESKRALEMLRQDYFDVVFCDEAADKIDRVAFPKAARKAEGVLNTMMPIFVMYSKARRREVERARDDGVTDVLTTPISAATILRKIDAAMLRPRPFIMAPDFFGPDRRTGTRGEAGPDGKDRRVRSPRKAKVSATTGKIKSVEAEKKTGDEVLI